MTSRYINFAQKNSELKFEGNTKGVLIIRFPVAGDSVNREADLIIDLGWWSRQTRLGSTFSASTVFKLPNGADRSFDAVWDSAATLGSPDSRRKMQVSTDCAGFCH